MILFDPIILLIAARVAAEHCESDVQKLLMMPKFLLVFGCNIGKGILEVRNKRNHAFHALKAS